MPDELTIRMLLERLSQPDCAGGCMLDGFPRNLEQAKALDSALAERGQAVDQVAYIRVGEEELMERLGGRWTCRQLWRRLSPAEQPTRYRRSLRPVRRRAVSA